MTPEATEDSIRAEHLIEALPYILSYQGAIVVIKFGGHAMLSPDLKDSFAKDLTLLRLLGFKPIVVHGGGPQIDEMLGRLHMETRFVEGLRYTDPDTMRVVEMVLTGEIGKDISSRISRAGGAAVGLSGRDDTLILAQRETIEAKDPSGGTEALDIGQVGRPVKINTKLLETLTHEGFIPIISPIGEDLEGLSYNINADTAASEVASALKARKLILLTDVEGVLDASGKLIPRLNRKDIEGLMDQGLIKGGMIPKLKCCLSALEKGCGASSIIDGRVPHSILLEIFTHRGSGTEITLD
jgi:acetylglutamate kinase